MDDLLISSRSPSLLPSHTSMRQSYKETQQSYHNSPSPHQLHTSSSRDLDRFSLLDMPSPDLSATTSLRQNPPPSQPHPHTPIQYPATTDNGILPSLSPTTPMEERYAVTNVTPQVPSSVNGNLAVSTSTASRVDSFTDTDTGESDSHPGLNRSQHHSLDMIEEAAISGSPPAFSPSPSIDSKSHLGPFDYEQPQQGQQDHGNGVSDPNHSLDEVIQTGRDGTHTAQSSPIPSAMAVESEPPESRADENDQTNAESHDHIKTDEELAPPPASLSESTLTPLKPFRASSFLSEPAPSPVGLSSPQLGIRRSASITSRNGAESMLHDEDAPDSFSKQRSDSQPQVSSADWTEAKVVPSPEPLIPDSLEEIGDISMVSSEAASNNMMLHEVFEGVQLNGQSNDEVVHMEDDRSHGRKQMQLKIDATQRLPDTPVARVKRISGGQRRNSEVLQPVHQRSNWETPQQQKQRGDKGGSSHRRGSLPNNVAFAPTANSALNIPLHHLPISSLSLTGHASHKRKHESPVPLQQLDPSSSADRLRSCELCQSCEACALHWKNMLATASEDTDKSSDAVHHPLSHGHIHSRPNSPMHTSNYNDPNLHHHHHYHHNHNSDDEEEDEDMLSPSSAAAEKSLSFLSSYQSHNGASFHKINYAIRTAESLDNSPFKLPTSLGMSPMISTKKKILKMIQGHVYPVQALLDVRLQNGHIYYFVEWKGFPDYFNSWEPAESLATNCSQLIEQFEEMHGKIEGGDDDAESVPSTHDDDAHSIKSQEKHSVFSFQQKQEDAAAAATAAAPPKAHEESEDLDLELHGHADTTTAPSKSPTPPPKLATRNFTASRLR